MEKLADEDDVPEYPDASTFNASRNPYTKQYIDPNVDKNDAIKRIKLSPDTMYLIDKVVRAKSLIGPIGIDNSEVINLEMEREYKKKNRYVNNLAANKPG